MLDNKNELITFFKTFIDILDKENLIYVAEAGTLLGAIREGKMIDWDDDIDVLIPIETFYKLKMKYPKNFLDISVPGYPFIFAKWVPNVDNYLNSPICVDLFPAILTTEKKIKKYSSFKNKFRFAQQMLCKKSKYKGFKFSLTILKIVCYPFQWMTKKITLDEVVRKYEEKENPEFYQFINNPNSRIKHEHRPLNVFKKRFKTKFEDFEIFVPNEYDQVLKANYGDDYMIPNPKNNNFEHVNAINNIRRKA